MEERKSNLKLYIKLLAFCCLCLIVLVTIPFSKFFESKLNKINIENYIDFDYILDKDCSVSVLDVGCADCIALKLPDGKKALFDFGVDTNKKVSDLYKQESINYLKNLFNENEEKVFDFVVLTHPDADHYNNFELLFDEFQINKVYRPAVFYSNSSHQKETEEELKRAKEAEFLSEDKQDFGDEIQTISTDLYRQFLNKIYSEPNCEYAYTFVKNGFLTLTSSGDKPYTITFYSPYKLKYSNNNSFSVVAILEYNNHRVCLTGDATEEVEGYLCRNNELKSVDLLKVGHHGSNTSSTQEFLNKLKPKYAFISVRTDTNNYKLPRNEVLQRLKVCGTEQKNIFQTQNCDNLVFAIDDNGVYVSATGDIVPQKFKWWHICLCIIIFGGVVIVIIKPIKKR
ncbi:MAG: hypothetical protein IJ837_01660 [Clostridia bacterium]|nr:hypothetical protein [Clostridia bacterium]